MLRLILVLLLAAVAWAAPPMSQPARPADKPRLIHEQPGLPNYRTSKDLDGAYRGNRKGLSSLLCSGSGAYSRASLDKIKQDAGGVPVVVVDLREETHGLLKDEPIGLEVSADNWGNVGRSPAEIARLEKEEMSRLGARTEEETVKAAGMSYLRLYVTDHLRPRDSEVDRFVRFVDGLKKPTWLHFHCRAGIGRTTVFMNMYDMLRNAKAVSFDEIIARQKAVPPAANVVDPRPGDPKAVYQKERGDFLRRFHEFARTRKPGQTWSQWLGLNAKNAGSLPAAGLAAG